MIWLVLPACAAWLLFVLWRQGAAGPPRDWRAAFDAAGITDIHGWVESISGHHGSLGIRMRLDVETGRPDGISQLEGRQRRPVLVVSVGGLGWEAHEFSLETPPGRLAERRILLGDPAFDEKLILHGERRQLLAILDAPVRQMLVELAAGVVHPAATTTRICFDGRASFRLGELQLELHGGDQAALSLLLPPLLTLAGQLVKPLDVPTRLAAHATNDPVPGVRRANLEALLDDLAPSAEAARHHLREAVRDPSETVRVFAAARLGAAGSDVLLDLALSAGADATREEAVRALGASLPRAHSLQVFDAAQAAGQRATLLACLEFLPYKGGPEVIDRLSMMLQGSDVELAAAAAKALGETGDAVAEPELIESLRDERLAVMTAAARALGKRGSAAAVLPLQEAAARRRDGDLHRVIELSIATIQDRLVGAGSGQLSLATGTQGQLSMADTAHGAVSLADRPARAPH